MNNSLTVQSQGGLALPLDLEHQLRETLGKSMSQYATTFRSISLRGNRFHFKDGGSTTENATPYLDAVVLQINSDRHCLYYQNKWKPGDDTPPDAIWMEGEGFPDKLPAAARQKDAEGRNTYQINHRAIIAVKRGDEKESYIDFENPYVLDVSSMSLFGQDIKLPSYTAYAFSNFIRFCQSSRAYPCMFMVRMIFDTNHSVPVLRFVVAGRLPDHVILEAANRAVSPEVMNMLKVNTYDFGEANITAKGKAPAHQTAPVHQTDPTAVASIVATPGRPSPDDLPSSFSAPDVNGEVVDVPTDAPGDEDELQSLLTDLMGEL